MQTNLYLKRDEIRFHLNEKGKCGYLPALPHLTVSRVAEEICKDYSILNLNLSVFFEKPFNFPITLKLPRDKEAPLSVFVSGGEFNTDGYGAFLSVSDLCLDSKRGFISVFKRSRKRTIEGDKTAAVAYAILASYDALLSVLNKKPIKCALFIESEFTDSAHLAALFEPGLKK